MNGSFVASRAIEGESPEAAAIVVFSLDIDSSLHETDSVRHASPAFVVMVVVVLVVVDVLLLSVVAIEVGGGGGENALSGSKSAIRIDPMKSMTRSIPRGTTNANGLDRDDRAPRFIALLSRARDEWLYLHLSIIHPISVFSCFVMAATASTISVEVGMKPATSPILIAFDVEGTGNSFARHAMVELGAVAYCADRPHDQLEQFSIAINIPKGRTWELRCLEEFWLKDKKSDLAHKARRIDRGVGHEPAIAMKKFISWVLGVVTNRAGGDYSRIRFISDNAAYDAAWVGLYLCEYADHEPLTTFFDGKFQGVIDTSSYHQGVSRHDHGVEMSLKRKRGHYSEDAACRAELGVPDDDVPATQHDHNAVNDAANIAQAHMIILKHMNAQKKK